MAVENTLCHVETREGAWAWADQPAVSRFDVVEGWKKSKPPSPRRNAKRGMGMGLQACHFAIRCGGGVVGVENPLCHVKTREEAWALACRN